MIVNILSAMLDEVSSSCNRPFGVRAPVTTWELFGASFTSFTRIQFLIFLNLLLCQTLPFHTADCETGFSLQNNLKNCQRTRLLTERLDTLTVISAEGPPLQEFHFERALIKCKSEKTQKIFSTSVKDRV